MIDGNMYNRGIGITLVAIILELLLHVVAQLHPHEPARYQTLPSLREQAQILDNWRDKRLQALPDLMKKYNVDAWLVSDF